MANGQPPLYAQPGVLDPTAAAPLNTPIAPPTDQPGVAGVMTPASAPPPAPTFLPPQGTVPGPTPSMPQQAATPTMTAADPGGVAIPDPYQGPALRGGPVKNALTRMMYGMGQAMLEHVGLPTDFEIQKQNFDQALKANDLQIARAHQQLLQQTQQYQESAITWRDPYTGNVYTAPPSAMAKIQQGAIGAGGRVAAVQARPQNLNEALAAAIKDSYANGQNPGDSPLVQALSAGLTGSKFNDTQQFINNYLQKNNLPNTPENWLQAHDAYVYAKAAPSFAPTTSTTTDMSGYTSSTTRRKQLPAGVQTGAPSAVTPSPVQPGAPSAATPTAGTSAPVQPGAPVPRRPLPTQPGVPVANRGGLGNSPLDDAAIQMVEGNTAPSQIPRRGGQNLVIQAKANRYSQAVYGKPFDPAQAQIDYDYAHNTGTQNTLKYLNSLTGRDNKSGNLQALVNLSNSPDLARTQWPPINDVQAWARLKSGSPAQAAYAALALETADQVGKILAGGQSQGTSDKKLNDAQALFQKGFTTEQMSAVANTLRGALGNRKAELIGDNRFLQRQFGQGGAGGGGGGNTPPPNATVRDYRTLGTRNK